MSKDVVVGVFEPTGQRRRDAFLGAAVAGPLRDLKRQWPARYAAPSPLQVPTDGLLPVADRPGSRPNVAGRPVKGINSTIVPLRRLVLNVTST